MTAVGTERLADGVGQADEPLLAVENLHGATHDLWSVNTDTEHHEVRAEKTS